MLKLSPLLPFLLLPLLTSAEFTFPDDTTIPPNGTCSTTYTRPLPCSPDLLSLVDNTTDASIRFAPTLLASTCTSECYSALTQWTSDIRRDCTNATFASSSSYIPPSSGTITLQKILDPKTQWLETAWFATCLTDPTLSTHPFCTTYNATTKSLTRLYNPALMQTLNTTTAFCNSSCAVQTSIYLHETSAQKPNVLDPRQVCPGLDTRPFPFPEAWKVKSSPGWQSGGESGRGVDGPVGSSNSTTSGEPGRPGGNETSANSTGSGWQTGGEGGRPSVNESTGNSTGWHQGGEGGRGLNNSSVVNDTQQGGNLPAANGAEEGARVSLLAVAIVIGAMVVGL
ncbi:uncharacterized protein H6S33_009741 [Morchella sextelata]|uniref:uncharacterized protein n=1 Tax=Morchella sextelata TaxID=1174677 RepID=UPI001D050B69|nr:uncharacterized protein H6S33_009741 [Morchella sextelata]KAH0613361.1 hypothetical protein H6S33_009741 [Morchella sextelata]